MAGFTNDSNNYNIMYTDNLDFSGSATPSATVTTDGQLLIGASSGQRIRVNTLTAGPGISITNGPGTITIASSGGSTNVDSFAMQSGTSPVVPDSNGLVTFSGGTAAAGTSPVITVGGSNIMTLTVQRSQAIAATDATKIGLCNFDSTSFSVDANGFVQSVGGGFTWNDISGAFSPLKNNGYIAQLTANGTLPASPSQGDTIKFYVDHDTQDLTITANVGQTIRIGSAISSTAGTALSTLRGDSCTLVFRTTGSVWMAIDVIGNWILS